MRAFIHDYESVELTDEECAEYGTLVDRLCYPDLQHRVSLWFATIARPQPDSVRDHICRQIERSWRVESRM
jgi:hypothetical protein